jgi:rhamnosyltransferase
MNRPNHSVAAAVVLYNPPTHVADTIRTYAGQVDHIYIVDNSTTQDPAILNELRSIDHSLYITNHGNHGIARALNTAAEKALADGYEFLLTMDQDTRLPADFVEQLLEVLSEVPADKLGIVAPRYSNGAEAARRYEPVIITMTSGNLLNLSVYRKVGRFLDELFIDHVDHEYCLRLNSFGFLVMQDNNLHLSHRPGETQTLNVGRKHISFSSHSPDRLYYFCRNGLYVSHLYGRRFPDFTKLFYKLLLKEVAKLPLEGKLFLKLRMLMKAVTDFKNRRLGPLKGQ